MSSSDMFIPAGAGPTLTPWRRTPTCAVQPRGRGADVVAVSDARPDRCSSPRARGRLHQGHPQAREHVFIPAGAGPTLAELRLALSLSPAALGHVRLAAASAVAGADDVVVVAPVADAAGLDGAARATARRVGAPDMRLVGAPRPPRVDRRIELRPSDDDRRVGRRHGHEAERLSRPVLPQPLLPGDRPGDGERPLRRPTGARAPAAVAP